MQLLWSQDLGTAYQPDVMTGVKLWKDPHVVSCDVCVDATKCLSVYNRYLQRKAA